MRTGFSTRAVHGGEKPDAVGAVATPIYETSVFAFTSARELIDVVSGKAEGYLYTRFDSPAVRAVERKMALLEGSEDAGAFASGMAAITTPVLRMVSKGDHVVASRDLYGGTLTFFQEVLPRFGVEVTFVDATNIGKVETTIKKNTRLVYAETPTNPTLKIVDLQRLAFLAASLGGTDTLATQPATSSHYFITSEQRQKLGITNQLVRLALGVEDPEDIIADLKQALNKI